MSLLKWMRCLLRATPVGETGAGSVVPTPVTIPPVREVAVPADKAQPDLPAAAAAAEVSLTPVFKVVSDTQGTLYLGNKTNIPHITFLLDCVDSGLEVTITSNGDMDSVRDIFELACMAVKRPMPDQIRFMPKQLIGPKGYQPDMAFDDQDFDYLPVGNDHRVLVMMDKGTPSIPYAELQKIAGITCDPA